MSSYPIHTIESAPAQSKAVLQQLQQAFGLIPNIAAAMAASPVLINGFIGLFERVHASSLTEPQIQTLLLTNAVTNASEWAVAFHTALALKQGVHPADVDAIRRGGPPNSTWSDLSI
jgi:alkylhydroperoxidase family enzyme